MGYRNYLHKIEKKKAKEVRNLTLDEIRKKFGDEDGYVYYNGIIPSEKCIFEYGKLYFDDTIQRIEESGEPFFTNNDVQEDTAELSPYLVGKEALKITIDIYKNKVKEMYDHLLNNKNLSVEETKKLYEEHLEYYNSWWTRCEVLNMDEHDECISKSWLYEHQIFELVRLYKTIDFDKYDLVFLGW